jgi:hypothetical protein
MGVSGCRLMCPSPERLRDDLGGLDAPLRQPHGDAADPRPRRAKAIITRLTDRCQPCQERGSL